MDLGLVTAAYSGYGRFVPQWLDAVAGMDPRPSKVTVVLGRKHGLDDVPSIRARFGELPLTFINSPDANPVMGSMRNAAVRATKTEWIMYVSADDIVLPDAIRWIEPHAETSDYICISWLSRALWLEDPPDLYHRGRTPQEVAARHGRGFIVGHSPFRRRFWALTPYMEHDYPNAPFIAGVIRNGGRFARTDEPCTVYLRRVDSHARRLGRRGAPIVRSEKRQAVLWKQHLNDTIREHYG